MTSEIAFCISYQEPKKFPLPWWEGMKGRGKLHYFIISIEFFASLF